MLNRNILFAIIKGLITYLPGIKYFLDRKDNSGHSCSNAEFCYALWLSSLVYLRENNIKTELLTVGEIGTGGSLGIGFCAILTGTRKYYALEFKQVFNIEKNLKLLEEIVILFKNKTPIPSHYKQINIQITNHQFPEDLIYKDKTINELTKLIKTDIRNGIDKSKYFEKIENWEKYPSLGLNFIFSRAVMEHVNNPSVVYSSSRFHLLNQSYMIHDIELHSHGLTKSDDGHLKIPRFIWSLMYGKRSYYLNRWTLSMHIKTIIENGFAIENIQRTYLDDKSELLNILHGTVILAKTK